MRILTDKLNEYGLYNNYDLRMQKGLLNLARFLYYNANDGAFDNMDEALSEVYNIMRGEFYIGVEEE